MAIQYDDFSVLGSKKKSERNGLDEVLQNDPVTKLVTVGDLLAETTPEKIELVQRRLLDVTQARLIVLLGRALVQRQRVSAWMLNCELTRRGVPPAFRPLDVNYDDAELFMDSFAFDLHWIATRYPKHCAYFNRWRKFIDPRYFHKQVRFIFNGTGRGRVPLYKVLKGLSLTIEQQRGCHFLRGDKLRNQHQQLDRMFEEIKNELEGRHMIRLHRSRGSVVRLLTEDHQIIRRRSNVWLCANLANWSPTKTAELYNAVNDVSGIGTLNTVAPITRQQASNVMQQIKRDLPKSSARPW